MTARAKAAESVVRGKLDAGGRLITADQPLHALHERAGGRPGGVLAVPQIAAIARLSRRMGIVVSRGVIAADGDNDLDLWVRAQPVFDGVELEISDWAYRSPRRLDRGRLAEREVDFRRAMVDWTWETDARLRVISLSSGAAAALGKTRTDFIGKQLTRLFRFREAEDGGLPILNALAEHRRFDDQIAELRTPEKPRYRLAGVPLIDGTGRFSGFRGTAVSEREEPVIEAFPLQEASTPETAEPGEAAAPSFGLRLDKALREPLHNIIAHAETITAQPEGPVRRDYAEYARDIVAAGRHLLALVDDLVDLQAIERPDFRPEAEAIDLVDIANRAAGLLSVRAAAKKVRVVKPDESIAVPVTGDFKRTLQIMMNLIANAIRYSPDGGEISISVWSEGAAGFVSVTDEGQGIAEKDQDRIFAKFERLDPSEPEGSGLGLYIARRLARAMGGDINVASKAGKGATFKLRLPAASGA